MTIRYKCQKCGQSFDSNINAYAHEINTPETGHFYKKEVEN
jgi:DNA-directed RNA polymerase subunit RPC12/RpoP